MFIVVYYRQLREPNTTTTDCMEENFMMTYEAMTKMTDAELNKRIEELSKVLYVATGDEWDKAYVEYFNLVDIQNERYRERNQAKFDAFYAKHIQGKSWEEIDPEAWGFYSDWHKDMYGFRPKHI